MRSAEARMELKILRKGKKKKGKRNGKSSGAKRHVYREKLGLSSGHTGKLILRTYFSHSLLFWVVKVKAMETGLGRKRERKKGKSKGRNSVSRKRHFFSHFFCDGQLSRSLLGASAGAITRDVAAQETGRLKQGIFHQRTTHAPF